MQQNRDYNVDMLNLYFKEKNFNKEQIQELLNTNPFGEDFCNWEKNYLFQNKLIATVLKKNHLININDKIQEITINKECCIGKHLFNDIEYKEININNDLNNIRNYGKLVLIRHQFKGEVKFLQNLNNKKNSFIKVICTNDYNRYTEMIELYKYLKKSIENLSLTCEDKNNLKICIIKKA